METPTHHGAIGLSKYVTLERKKWIPGDQQSRPHKLIYTKLAGAAKDFTSTCPSQPPSVSLLTSYQSSNLYRIPSQSFHYRFGNISEIM